MTVALLGRVLDELQESLAIIDLRHCILQCNTSLQNEVNKYLGVQLLPGFNLQIPSSNTLKRINNAIDTAIAGEKNTILLHAHELSGNTVFYQCTLAPLKNEQQQVEAVLLTVKQAQQNTSLVNDLLLANSKLKHIQQAIDTCAMVAVLDESTSFLQVNDFFCNAMELPAHAFVGQSLANVINNIQGEVVSCANELVNTLKSGQTWRAEVNCASPTGKSLWIDAAIYPIEHAIQGITGYLLIGFDISSRKEKEIAAQENERFFRSILENLPVGLQQLTPEGFSVDMNSALRDILGPGHPAVIGEPYNLFNDPLNYRNGLRELLQEVKDSRGPIKKEILLKYTEHPDHGVTRIQPTYYEVTGFPVIDQQNNISFLFLILSEITEKKLAELSLEKSERLLHTIVENLPIGYMQFDNFGNARRINQTQRAFLGLQEGESEHKYNMIDHPFAKLFELDKLFMQVLQQGKMLRVEKKLDFTNEPSWKRAQKTLFLDLTLFPVEDPVDKDQLIVTLVNDITVEKNQALENEKNQDFLLQTGAIGKIGGWELDAKTQKLRWSTQTYHIHELYHQHDITLEGALDFYTPESRSIIEKAAKDCMEKGIPYDVQVEIVTAHGNLVVVRSIGQPEYKNGEIVRIHGVLQDITEQFQMRYELTQNAELMRLFFDTIDMGYALMDQDGTVNFMNKKAGEMLDTETVVGKNIFDVFPWLVGTTFHARVKECITGQKPVSFFNYLPELDKWYEFLLAPMQNGNISIFTRNITYSKKLQRELRKANDQLSNLNKYLVNQNKQLEDFAHITSHNLRAPIANLKALMQIYKETDSQEERGMYVGMLDDVIRNIDETLNDLLEVVQIRKDLNVERENLQFVDRLQKIKDILLVDIETSNIMLTYDFSSAPSIDYPRIYLDSILQNLLTNAIKYRSPNRRPSLHLRTWTLDGNVYLSAEDNGIGIDLERFGHKIFGFRKTFHKNKDAKGIGLFITKSQVEAMGGQIKVESTPNVGTKFIITFRPE
ncbi:PAS domain S-box-containing protein [Chitinophaga skermanii]|uniref:histidine kinase n=1 Tax=Chitinophaga skermanii TaxID=331697 RepID=A0A327QQJ8_9BACT|nr:PAS domain S-box protein [Chitinophaga skermanii]RAJ06866.1 PAS domain S-box-containing protein [Chitinophaga skermanii]